MKPYIITTIMLLASGLAANAQWYNDGASTNAGGLISNWTNQAINTATGSYSTTGSTGPTSNYGVFEHRGQSGSGASAAFVNDGSFDATVFGRDYFFGPGGAAGQQEISGSSMPAFAELFIQNGAASVFDISNTNGIRIATNVAFENGITTTVRSNTNTGSIKLDDNATYSNTALGDAQHVNGYVTKTGNDAFTYPVGSGTDLRTLSITTAPPSATDQYSVAWMVGDPSTNGDPSNGNAMNPVSSFTAPITSVSTVGQWDWIPVSGTGAGLGITVSIPVPTGLGSPAAADLRLVGWNGSSWVDLSGSPNASGVTENSTLSGTMIPGIQAIGIGSAAVPLAVTFSSFDVQKQGCVALIDWTTDMEINNDHFDVERSADGRTFAAIGTVVAGGNSNTQQHYSYVDKAPLAGLNHYRVTQVDIDGKHSSTTVKSIEFDCEHGAVKVYPTVTQGTLYVDLPVGYENADIQVYNALGQVLNLPNTGKVSGSGLHTIQLAGVAQGQYLVRVANGSNVQTFKVIYK